MASFHYCIKSGKKGNSFEDNIFTLDPSFNQKAEPIPEPLPVHKTEPVRPNDDEDDGPALGNSW